jgi:cytochrome c biogenesis protein
VKAVYGFFKSVRLKIVLILAIAALSLLASLVPQGRSDAWYGSHYSPVLTGLIRRAGLPRFFSSAGFLIPAFLLTLNLGVCAVDRVIRRVKNKARPRYGPDLIHLGLLILIAGGVVTALGRQETRWSLAVGEDAALSSTYALHLLSLQFLKYDNGAPKEWTSMVRVTREGNVEIPSFPIRVNQPLRLKGLSVYQTARELRAGDTLGPYTISGITAREVTGLKAVSDPGFAPLLAALLIIAAGLCLTFIQSRGEAAT